MASRETVRRVLAVLAVTFPGFDRTFGSGDADAQRLRLETWTRAFAHRADDLLELAAARLVTHHTRLDVLPADLHAAADYLELAEIPEPGKAWAQISEVRRGVRALTSCTWAEGLAEALERAGGWAWLKGEGAELGVLAAQFRRAFEEVREEWIAGRRDPPAVVRKRAELAGKNAPQLEDAGTAAAAKNDPADAPVDAEAARGFLAQLWARVGRPPKRTTSATGPNPDPVNRNVVQPDAPTKNPGVSSGNARRVI